MYIYYGDILKPFALELLEYPLPMLMLSFIFFMYRNIHCYISSVNQGKRNIPYRASLLLCT